MCPAETILVVEDNPDIADLLTNDFLPSLGYEVLHAGSGEQAISMLEKVRVDLIILDFNLPGIDGVTTLRKLVERGLLIPTILVTAHGSEQVAVDAFRLGICNYLTKPLDLEQLSEVIDSTFRWSRLQRERDVLLARLEQQIQQSAVLSRVGQLVTGSLGLNGVARGVVEAAIYLTGADEGFLFVVDEQTGELTLRAEKRGGQHEVALRRLPVHNAALERVLHNGKPIRLSERTGDAKDQTKGGPHRSRSILHVPITAPTRALGLLTVIKTERPVEFGEADEQLLAALRDYAASAIQDALVFEASHRAT